MPTASSLLGPLISSGLGLQWLEAWLGFPAKDWAESQWWKHQILDSRPVVSDKGPGFQLCRKEFPQRQNVVKQVFTKRKKSTVSMDRHKGRLRERIPESFPCSGLSYFYGIFLPGFLWTIILTCRVHSSYLVYLRILPCVCTHLSAKILPNRHLGRTTFDITSLWPPKSLSVHLLSRGSPDFENKKYVVWAGPSFLALIALIALLFLSWGFCQ